MFTSEKKQFILHTVLNLLRNIVVAIVNPEILDQNLNLLLMALRCLRTVFIVDMFFDERLEAGNTSVSGRAQADAHLVLIG